MYEFKNTEINNKKGADFETKSLLYLIGMRKDKKDISILTVDCFNDVTGANDEFDKLWDVQAKNHKTISPKQIGEFLFTLFDNFLSSIKFYKYILFVPKLKKDYLKNSELNIYKTDNFVDSTFTRIKNGLIEEAFRVYKEDSFKIRLDDFFKEVSIVQDHSRISTYVKNITEFKQKSLKNEDFYLSVFNEIRDMQVSKKQTEIEGITINNAKEVLSLKRHITAKEISVFVIQRIIGCEVFISSSIPPYFIKEVITLDPEDITDLIENCNANLSRAFFDKNSNKEFWKITEFVVSRILHAPNDDIYMIMAKLNEKFTVKSQHLDNSSLLFFISLIKLGIKNGN